jgi:hypothetical protein
MTTAMAQEQDPWVGTWTSESYTDMDWENSPKDSEGTYMEIIKTDYKIVIRITKNGDQYNVRAKTIKVKDPTYSSYHRPLTVKRIEGNTMWLESYVKKNPFTVKNGNSWIIDSYSDITAYKKMTINNGVLHYSYYKMYSVKYDRNMNYKGETTTNVSDWPGNDLDLFNDDW